MVKLITNREETNRAKSNVVSLICGKSKLAVLRSKDKEKNLKMKKKRSTWNDGRKPYWKAYVLSHSFENLLQECTRSSVHLLYPLLTRINMRIKSRFDLYVHGEPKVRARTRAFMQEWGRNLSIYRCSCFSALLPLARINQRPNRFFLVSANVLCGDNCYYTNELKTAWYTRLRTRPKMGT